MVLGILLSLKNSNLYVLHTYVCHFLAIDMVIEDCNGDVEESHEQNIRSLDYMHLLPPQKTRRQVVSRNSEIDCATTFDQMSIHSTPSMFSLVSIPNESESNVGINVVIGSYITILSCISSSMAEHK